MGDYHIIDMLCSVTNDLAEIVKKQAEVIAQYQISEEVSRELKEMRDKADSELDVIEYNLRRRIM